MIYCHIDVSEFNIQQQHEVSNVFFSAQESLFNQVSPTGLGHVKLSTTNTSPGL